MNLQTKIPLRSPGRNPIDYGSKLVLLGSCFSENIGEKFNYYKFPTSINPFGILFHPLAIENLVSRSLKQSYYSETELQFHNEQWSCLDAHSKLNRATKEDLLKVLNSQLDETYNNLHNASHIVITLGTGWVYRHLDSNQVVANCHKLPQKQFKKELLSIDEIVASLESLVSLVKEQNPKVTFLFTVSPVRHIKDGFVENTQSKAHLIAGIHKFLKQYSASSNEMACYFPSYEIMMDELRDYRFYNSDMLHPNALAVDYIWERFFEVWISKDGQQTMKLVDEIQKGLAHKPFNPKSTAHQKFLVNLQNKIEQLQNKYAHISF